MHPLNVNFFRYDFFRMLQASPDDYFVTTICRGPAKASVARWTA